jgi:hypothetical protein
LCGLLRLINPIFKGTQASADYSCVISQYCRSDRTLKPCGFEWRVVQRREGGLPEPAAQDDQIGINRGYQRFHRAAERRCPSRKKPGRHRIVCPRRRQQL